MMTAVFPAKCGFGRVNQGKSALCSDSSCFGLPSSDSISLAGITGVQAVTLSPETFNFAHFEASILESGSYFSGYTVGAERGALIAAASK